MKVGFDFRKWSAQQPFGVLIKPARLSLDINLFRNICPKRAWDESLESIEPVNDAVQITAIHDHQASQGGLETGFVLTDQTQTKPLVFDGTEGSRIPDPLTQMQEFLRRFPGIGTTPDLIGDKECQMAEHRFGEFRPFQAAADGFVEGNGGFRTQTKRA